MKVVINSSYGGFCITVKAIERLIEEGFVNKGYWESRHDPILVRVVEEMGAEAGGDIAALVVVEFDDKYLGCYEIGGDEFTEWVRVDWPGLIRKLVKGLTEDNVVAWKANLLSLLDLDRP